MLFDKHQLPSEESALKGRDQAIEVPTEHFVNGHAIAPPFPGQLEVIYVGMGCFWGAERLFWKQQGVWTTAVGYAGGYTPNPTYEEVCSGGTGHAEVVMVAFDPNVISLESLLRLFWESHDPTQGMQQGNDRGTQYRSVIYTTFDEQSEKARESMAQYQTALNESGKGKITTEIVDAPVFYYAEAYHQQYLAKNPEGYCGLAGTGVCLPPILQV
ncbi:MULTISPECIES: peptide-methionine (S)-S-oxide reductase MsrA [unclassified Endozoicomonas]|uniref:peptide-methionine (S)-S-oxide reductase MsrA n=1 Tax=unclassified Endozoicomonas TaxID=2644528 RepID=UPI0021477970|nr:MULTISPECIES: peptide-methionine (S)-S-oxide reductase MsrA [unclassified Endozoicomonas]